MTAEAAPRLRFIAIAGPTASGKSSAALSLATQLGGEIVSADSVQVYRGFDIGSAKPSAEEQRGTPHHLIDILDPTEAIDAMGYADRAEVAIADVTRRGRVPIVVGGTGLWMRALIRGLVDVPPVSVAIRERLEADVEAHGAPAVHARLAEVDPQAAAKIHPNDALRIVRALEVFEQTGEAMGELRRRHALGEPRHDVFCAVVDRETDELTARIEGRVDAMLAAGFADEVRTLLAAHDAGARAFGSLGYKEMVAHVRGEVDADETRRRIITATRTYARRQRTWWKSEPGTRLRTTPDALVGPAVADDLRAFMGR